MFKYSNQTIVEVKRLRSLGYTYSEIRVSLRIPFSKSTLSNWCKEVLLPSEYTDKIVNLNKTNLIKARELAHGVIKNKRANFLNSLKSSNIPVANKINEVSIAKIALAMLCLGEASKYNPKAKNSFYLGSSKEML